MVPGLRYSANLSMLWPDRGPFERFDAAAAAGFRHVEMLFPQQLDLVHVEDRLARNGLSMALFDLYAGDWEAGERGVAALPDRSGELLAQAVEDLDVAARLGTPVVTVLAGRPRPDDDRERCDTVLVENLKALAPYAAERGIVLALEAINGVDVPGYHVRTVDHGAAVVAAVGHEAVGLQLDQYHVAMEGGDPVAVLDAHAARVRHVQIADAPGRHEPGTGTADVAAFLNRLDEHGYQGTVGLEYRPQGDTDAGLGWLPRHLRGR